MADCHGASLYDPRHLDTCPVVLDHFQCYQVNRTLGTPSFAKISNVKVDSQFGTGRLTLTRPYRLCIPANKNNENPAAPSHRNDLLCYKPKRRNFAALNPTIRNQFGLLIQRAWPRR